MTTNKNGQSTLRPEFQIPSLDGLRAVSFILVFLAHAGFGWLPGGFGVAVFFFLSGYLITTLLRVEHTESGLVSFRNFYLRRALRIFPSFYVVLALSVLATVAGWVSGGLELGPMSALVFHYANYWAVDHGFDGQPFGTGVYWSLAVEEHFYLVFPLLFVFLQRVLPNRLGAQSGVLLALCAAALAWRVQLVFAMGATPVRTFLATDTRFDSILIGCALALGANPVLDPPRVSDGVLRVFGLPLGLLSLAASFVFRGDEFRETLRYSLQGLGLVPIFVTAIRLPTWGPIAWLNHPWVARVGVLSYSLYLVHQVVIGAVYEGSDLPVPVPVRGLISLLISLALAEVIHRTVERPCAKLRRKLTRAKRLQAMPLSRTGSAISGDG